MAPRKKKANRVKKTENAAPSVDENISDIISRMRIADLTQDNGAFSSLSLKEMIQWLELIGIDYSEPTVSVGSEDLKVSIIEKLRRALWDTQRIDLLFHGQTFSTYPNLNLLKLDTWPRWKEPHPELRSTTIGLIKLDAYKEAERLNSYAWRHFQLSAFTQAEIMQQTDPTHKRSENADWITVKQTMARAAMDITREGGNDTPFITYSTDDKGPGTSMLVMEILDVKQAPWPEPTAKELKEFKLAQQCKFGDSADGPLNPIMQTPKMPVIVVRYAYVEGRPKDGLQFLSYLREQIQSNKGITADEAHEKLKFHLCCGESIPKDPLRMFARLLSHNSTLVDEEWKNDMQGHWNVSKAVAKETHISFFVPCLRLRFRALEEIETGKPITIPSKCENCGKDGTKMMCASCKSVYYCNLACSKASWPKHKQFCKFTDTILKNPSSLPPTKFYLSTLGYVSWVLDFGFAVEQENVRIGGCSVYECPRNEYGNQRFVCRAAFMPDGEVGMRRPSIVIYDRRRTVIARTGDLMKENLSKRGITVPFHQDGFTKLAQLIISQGYLRGFSLYVWAKRVGDCIEIDLGEFPDMDQITWT